MEVHDSINTLDYIVLGIIALSGLFALMTGFVREVYSLFNWIASYFIAVKLYPLAEPVVSNYIGNPHTVINASIAVTFIVSFIILALAGMILTKILIRGGTLTLIDRSLGFVFGIVRGILIVSLVYMVAVSTLWPNLDKAEAADQVVATDTTAQADKDSKSTLTAPPKWLTTARTRPLMAKGASFLRMFIPDKALENAADELLKKKEAEKQKDKT